jgi:hypothetical protein
LRRKAARSAISRSCLINLVRMILIFCINIILEEGRRLAAAAFVIL